MGKYLVKQDSFALKPVFYLAIEGNGCKVDTNLGMP